jgi:hypothetical protein
MTDRRAPGRSVRAVAALTALASLVLSTGCGHSTTRLPEPRFFGRGPQYHPPAYGRAVAAARPIGPFACANPPSPARSLAHVEVLANGLVVLMPSGIGVAPPQVRRGAYVARGRCEYPLRTHEPTGLVEIVGSRPLTLGDLFRIWEQPLSRRRVLGFTAPPGGAVVAFVGSRRRAGDPRAIPLRDHTAVTLEVGRVVPPRRRYAFPPLPR